MQFIDDAFFDETIQTPHGPVRVFAETHVFGPHLVLDEMLFFPLEQRERMKIGVNRVLAINRGIRVAAKEAGFTEITVSYHRLGRSGNTIIHNRRLK
jgi:hypothetical protein